MTKRERLLLEAYKMCRIGNDAVQKAQQDNFKKGVPNVYCLNGTLYYQLPDLSITTTKPF